MNIKWHESCFIRCPIHSFSLWNLTPERQARKQDISKGRLQRTGMLIGLVAEWSGRPTKKWRESLLLLLLDNFWDFTANFPCQCPDRYSSLISFQLSHSLSSNESVCVFFSQKYRLLCYLINIRFVHFHLCTDTRPSQDLLEHEAVRQMLLPLRT